MKLKFWSLVASALWRLGLLTAWYYAVKQSTNAQVEQDLRNYA